MLDRVSCPTTTGSFYIISLAIWDSSSNSLYVGHKKCQYNAERGVLQKWVGDSIKGPSRLFIQCYCGIVDLTFELHNVKLNA